MNEKTSQSKKEISFTDTEIVIRKDAEGNPYEEIIPSFIPQCCREGWPTCPHVLQKQKKVKKNIAL